MKLHVPTIPIAQEKTHLLCSAYLVDPHHHRGCHCTGSVAVRNSGAGKKLNENLLEMGIHQMDATWEGLDNVYRSIYLNEAFREYLLHYGQQTGPNAAASESDLLKRVFLSSLSSRADLYSIIFVDNSGRLTYATREESGSVPSMRTLRFRMRILPVWNPIR